MSSVFPSLSRRQFLTSGTAVAAGLAVGASPLHACIALIPSGNTTRRLPPDAWLPDPPSSDQLRTLALVAMDAARAAGADVADVRIGVQRRVVTYGRFGGPVVALAFGYGVRAWHGGTWSFQHGNVLTADAMAATAKSAVAGARIYADIDAQLAPHRRRVAGLDVLDAVSAWAPAPVVTGQWAMPVRIDPFTVPLDDYQRVIDALVQIPAPRAVEGEMTARALGYVLAWDAETRVFASTNGSLVTQDTMRGGLGIQAIATLLPIDHTEVFLHNTAVQDVCGGFETALRPEIPEYIQQVYDAAVRWEELPYRAFGDVGRFPVVFDGRTMGRIVGTTLNVALDGDRVSGLEADASGGSFFSPPDLVLGAEQPQCSSLLTLRAHRTLPSPMAVQWDDDGVVPETYTLMERGRVVDYHTTRETAPMLAAWYARQGRSLRSHGCAVAPTPASVPRGSGGHLVVASASTSARIDELTRDISHGFLIINGAAGANANLSLGDVSPELDGLAVEVRNGVPISRTALHLRFSTQALLRKNLVALGDATTEETADVASGKGIPWQSIEQRISAPAALCADVDVVYA